MNLDDRLRREFDRRSADIEPTGAGPEAVIASARARNRRARIVGGVAVGLFLVAVGGGALVLRDNDGEATTTATASLPEGSDSMSDSSEGPDSEAPAVAGSTTAVSGELATTEPDGTQGADDSDPSGPTDAAGEQVVEPEPAESTGEAPTESAPAAASRSATSELISHERGFIALQGEGVGASLAFTADGQTWTAVSDPKPTRRSSITQVTSHDGVLYVAGDRPSSNGSRPWVASTADLRSWTDLAIPVPAGDDAELIDSFTRVYGLAAGPAGLLVTGETIVDLRIEALIDADVLDSGSWSLGDSTGDLTKVIVYDADGEITEEIDLIAAGVPRSTIDRWSTGEPTSYVATAKLGGSFSIADAQLEPGTILVDGVVTANGFVSAGFSNRFSSRIVWTSSDGATWESQPVGVVANEQAEEIGLVDGAVTVFASQGPLLTVQQQRGGDWREARLDTLFGNPNDDYLLVDAAFDNTGVAAIVATVGQSDSSTLWLATSDDARSWSLTPLAEAFAVSGAVTNVHSIGIDGDAIALSFSDGAGRSQFVLVDR